MRLFISLNLDEEAQERLVQLQDRLAALAHREGAVLRQEYDDGGAIHLCITIDAGRDEVFRPYIAPEP